MEKIKVLCEKYRELLLYVVFGGLTTLVSFVSYWIFADGFHIHYMASTVLSWIVSVTFAYVTNRRWVFESRAHGFRAVCMEIVRFYACRVDLLHLNDKAVKLVANVIVVIANYVLSKLIVFRKKRGVDESA